MLSTILKPFYHLPSYRFSLVFNIIFIIQNIREKGKLQIILGKTQEKPEYCTEENQLLIEEDIQAE